MATSRGFEIFQGYSAALLSADNVSVAARLARNLKASFLSYFGRRCIWHLKASLELTKLLELDDSTVLETVEIYDEINAISMLLGTTDEANFKILRVAQESLSILVSSKTNLHDRAEEILVESWQQAVKRHSHSHERSISTLRKLFSFWASRGKIEHREQALRKLREAILGTMAKETDPTKLFQLAESFCVMSSMSNLCV